MTEIFHNSLISVGLSFSAQLLLFPILFSIVSSQLIPSKTLLANSSFSNSYINDNATYYKVGISAKDNDLFCTKVNII